MKNIILAMLFSFLSLSARAQSKEPLTEDQIAANKVSTPLLIKGTALATIGPAVFHSSKQILIHAKNLKEIELKFDAIEGITGTSAEIGALDIGMAGAASTIGTVLSIVGPAMVGYEAGNIIVSIDQHTNNGKGLEAISRSLEAAGIFPAIKHMSEIKITETTKQAIKSINEHISPETIAATVQ